MHTFDPQQWRWCMSGAAPVPAALIEACAKLGVEVHQIYGLTESCGPAALIDADARSNGSAQPEHSCLLIIVTLIENIGSAAIGALTLYVTQYVVGAPHMGPAVILAYMIPSAFSVPLWIPLSRRIGKVRLWMYSMIGTGVSFGAMFALPFLPPELRLGAMFVFAAFAGLAAGCGGTVGPSVQGDVIDYDEHLTGERKEGSYFAAWNFVYKSAAGIMLALAGFVLDFSGFVPNQPQTLTTQVWIVGLYGLFPLICYAIGAALFSRFKLNEAAYAEIRRKLDADADARVASSA